MFSKIQKLSFVLLAVIMFFGQPALAAADFTAEQKQAIESMIADYISKNPEIIIKSFTDYQQAQQQQQQASAQEAIKSHMPYLTAASLPSIGNPDADVTVVEFFDYNCGYCKRAVPDIQAILKEDKNVRFVFKEMPILGPTSVTASEWALAAHKQDKYFDYHVALMEHRGPKTEDELSKIAKDLGLNVDQMRKDAKSDDVQNMIAKSIEIAQQSGIQGTPAFIVEGTLYPGYLGPDGLKAAIKDHR